MQPGFGTPVVIGGYGNGASSGGSMPSITNEVFAAVPRSQMRPATLTNPPRMPLTVEKLTPRNVSTEKVYNAVAANARVRVVSRLRRLRNTGKGYANVIRTRFYQDIGTALTSR